MRIAIGAGHWKHVKGKEDPNGVKEWIYNDKVVDAAIAELNRYEGVHILRFDDPTGEKEVTLSDRSDKSDSFKADICVEYHHNALNGKWGSHGGSETFYFEGSKNGLKLAQCVNPKVNKAMGIRDRGIKKGNHLYMVKTPKAPAILVEGGFMDSTIDIEKMRDDQVLRNTGIALAKGIAEYGNLKLKNVIEKKPVQPEVPKQTTNKSIDELAQEVIDGKHGNGSQREKSLGKDFDAVQKRVNDILSGNVKKRPKTVSELADEVIAGLHGSGRERMISLGSNYAPVQMEVNRRFRNR